METSMRTSGSMEEISLINNEQQQQTSSRWGKIISFPCEGIAALIDRLYDRKTQTSETIPINHDALKSLDNLEGRGISIAEKMAKLVAENPNLPQEWEELKRNALIQTQEKTNSRRGCCW